MFGWEKQTRDDDWMITLRCWRLEAKARTSQPSRTNAYPPGAAETAKQKKKKKKKKMKMKEKGVWSELKRSKQRRKKKEEDERRWRIEFLGFYHAVGWSDEAHESGRIGGLGLDCSSGHDPIGRIAAAAAAVGRWGVADIGMLLDHAGSKRRPGRGVAELHGVTGALPICFIYYISLSILYI